MRSGTEKMNIIGQAYRNERRQFSVVQLKELLLSNIDKLVCVPNSWIVERNCRDVVIAFPPETLFNAKIRARRGEEYGRDWKHYMGVVKYDSDTYDESEQWIASRTNHEEGNFNIRVSHLKPMDSNLRSYTGTSPSTSKITKPQLAVSPNKHPRMSIPRTSPQDVRLNPRRSIKKKGPAKTCEYTARSLRAMPKNTMNDQFTIIRRDRLFPSLLTSERPTVDSNIGKGTERNLHPQSAKAIRSSSNPDLPNTSSQSSSSMHFSYDGFSPVTKNSAQFQNLSQKYGEECNYPVINQYCGNNTEKQPSANSTKNNSNQSCKAVPDVRISRDLPRSILQKTAHERVVEESDKVKRALQTAKVPPTFQNVAIQPFQLPSNSNSSPYLMTGGRSFGTSHAQVKQERPAEATARDPRRRSQDIITNPSTYQNVSSSVNLTEELNSNPLMLEPSNYFLQDPRIQAGLNKRFPVQNHIYSRASQKITATTTSTMGQIQPMRVSNQHEVQFPQIQENGMDQITRKRKAMVDQSTKTNAILKRVRYEDQPAIQSSLSVMGQSQTAEYLIKEFLRDLEITATVDYDSHVETLNETTNGVDIIKEDSIEAVAETRSTTVEKPTISAGNPVRPGVIQDEENIDQFSALFKQLIAEMSCQVYKLQSSIIEADGKFQKMLNEFKMNRKS